MAVPNHLKRHHMDVVPSFRVLWHASDTVCDNGDLAHSYSFF